MIMMMIMIGNETHNESSDRVCNVVIMSWNVRKLSRGVAI